MIKKIFSVNISKIYYIIIYYKVYLFDSKSNCYKFSKYIFVFR